MKYRNAGIVLFIVLLLAVILLNKNDIALIAQDEFSLQPISSSGYVLQSIIHLNNSNLLSSTIKTIHEEFKLNGVVIGIIDNELNQGIAGRKESSFPVTIRFAREDYLRALHGDSLSKQPLNIEVTGEITFANVITGGKIIVQQTATVPLAQQEMAK
jgi:hypothetical protein